MSQNIATTQYRYQNAKRQMEEISGNAHFLFVGDHIPHDNSTLQDVSSDTSDTLVDAYRNMIFGKRIANTDIAFLIRNVPYVANTLYDMYDDDDQSLEDRDFYVIVDEGSFFHIWKCLDNNSANNSTAAPSFAAGATANLYQTADGYRWKYMASVSSANADKFQTSSYFPILANSSVQGVAIEGAIDIIKIENEGAKYNNWLDGQFRNANLRINGDTTLYGISNNNVNFTNGYYTGCVLYLTGGTGVGQYKRITDYVSNSTTNVIRLESAFDVAPLNGTTYEIRPEVTVFAKGDAPTINCTARALVNTLNSNSVYRVEVLERGAGYRDAFANVVSNSVVGVTNTAILRVINGPHGGHGYWQYQELFVKDLEVAVTFSNTIGNTVPAQNQYQQLGIVRTPEFANVNISLSNNVGNFTTGETIYRIAPYWIQSNVTCVAANTRLSSNSASWFLQVAPDDYLYIANPGNTVNQLVQVNNVINSTAMELKTPVLFSCTSLIVYGANISSNAYVTLINSSNNIMVTNCSPEFDTSQKIIGDESGAIGFLNTFTRNDVVKSFNTFINLYKYSATIEAGTFIDNEVLLQGNTSGYLFGFEGANLTVLYASNFSRLSFDLGEVVGNTSSAVANLTQAYLPELVHGSGEVIYIENIDPVERQNNQTEAIQIILNF